MALEHLSDTSFDGFIKNDITIVDFWASWCVPCQAFGPIFEKESDTNNNIKFGKYEITDSNRRMAAKYGVRSIPSILAFKKGELVDTQVGLMDESSFTNWIRSIS